KIIFFIGFTLILVNACRQTKTKGAEVYANRHLALQSEVVLQVDSFFQAVNYKPFDAALFYQSAVLKNEEKKMELNKLGAFKGDKTLQLSSLSLLNTIDSVLKNDGQQLLLLDQEVSQNYSQKGLDRIDHLLVSSFIKISNAQIIFDSVLTKFMGKYGYEIEMDTSTIHYQDTVTIIHKL
ncbi:MAG: hypothetical protein RR034_07380, partial [Bacteroidales bacterium]